jgi:hypothetical protein
MPTAQPYIEVSFQGSRIFFEDAYTRAVEACLGSLLRKYKGKYFPTGKVGDKNPIDQISQLVHEHGLPGYVRPAEYQQIREAIKALRVDNTLFSPRQAHLFARSLVTQIPALHALDVRRVAQEKGRD